MICYVMLLLTFFILVIGKLSLSICLSTYGISPAHPTPLYVPGGTVVFYTSIMSSFRNSAATLLGIGILCDAITLFYIGSAILIVWNGPTIKGKRLDCVNLERKTTKVGFVHSRIGSITDMVLWLVPKLRCRYLVAFKVAFVFGHHSDGSTGPRQVSCAFEYRLLCLVICRILVAVQGMLSNGCIDMKDWYHQSLCLNRIFSGIPYKNGKPISLASGSMVYTGLGSTRVKGILAPAFAYAYLYNFNGSTFLYLVQIHSDCLCVIHGDEPRYSRVGIYVEGTNCLYDCLLCEGLYSRLEDLSWCNSKCTEVEIRHTSLISSIRLDYITMYVKIVRILEATYTNVMYLNIPSTHLVSISCMVLSVVFPFLSFFSRYCGLLVVENFQLVKKPSLPHFSPLLAHECRLVGLRNSVTIFSFVFFFAGIIQFFQTVPLNNVFRSGDLGIDKVGPYSTLSRDACVLLILDCMLVWLVKVLAYSFRWPFRSGQESCHLQEALNMISSIH